MTKDTNTDEINITPPDEVSLETVRGKAVRGIAFLTGRTFLLNILSLIAQGVLWAFISPSEFGVFLLVSATINFLSYFADIGLGAALIQKREKPEDSDFKTVFTVQEILVTSIVVLVFLISPILAKTKNFDAQAIYLLYALNISFFLASLKNIPSIMLERKLEFGKFIIPQVFENLIYNISIVFFAWQGFGITTFTYSVLIRGIVGVVTIYLIQPWKPAFGISRRSLSSLLKFGIPYQLNNFLATVKDDGMTIVIGGILGNFGLGILGTAQKLADYPLRIFMDNVTKVTFPAFSRMQDNKVELAGFLNRSVFFICALVFPALFGLVTLFPVLITVIPKYGKWAPALVPLVFLSAKNIWSAASTQLTNFLNSVGKIKTTFKLMVMWTVLTWAFVPLFSKLWGITGASVAYTLVGVSSVVVFYIVKKEINWSLSYSVIKPLISSIVMSFVLLILMKTIPQYNLFNFSVLVLCGSLTYIFSLYLLVGESVFLDVKKIFTIFLNK